ncbi:Lrp/AsnC family transcriptional regulator [Gordonia westfalica]|uniref:DNA-binding transcriptional regulator, Lrp family n=1 Tax=Gordonia westfalica TaxID=158898 RepID=A0A1H2KWW8_9ACTN|nr:Lrp/AsnC family transcriptional regulator [Gordonia westfalica]MDS1113408.1 Lrp/AsnC family transcriptional regulator [Gordonia westfalica]SDU73257.1 DNA-binding transcriptional regulator, Lrp family [Gordonia westfalica]
MISDVGSGSGPSGTDADLDAVDHALIDVLQADGRARYSDLARLVDLTEKTVRKRVARLLAEGFITIGAVTDPARLGFGATALALLTVDGTRPPTIIAAELARLPQVDYVTVTTGPFVIQVELICVDGAELREVLTQDIRSLPGVGQVEVLPYLRIHYQEARFHRDDVENSGVRPRELDSLDQRIVARLAVDGRASFREVARELDVSEATIRQRHARLTESGAVHVMAIVNPLRMGYSHTCWVGIRLAPGARAQDVAEGLTKLSRTSYVALTVGRYDVLAELVTGSGDELLDALDDGVRLIPGVGTTEIMVYEELHYKALLPRRSDAAGGHESDIQTV